MKTLFALGLIAVATPALAAPISSVVAYANPDTGQIADFSDDLYDSAFISTPIGFAVASTSSNFGGSAMATASSTDYLHAGFARLEQNFTLPTFLTSGRITLDLRGQAFAIGSSVGLIGYQLQKIVGADEQFVAEQFLYASQLAGYAGSNARLSARRTVTLNSGEGIRLVTLAAVETGFSAEGTNWTTFAGPGYATAFMDPVVTFSAGVPEPASWAMLIAGFGLVGASARRRRTAETKTKHRFEAMAV
jgi:hypothetical protein